MRRDMERIRKFAKKRTPVEKKQQPSILCGIKDKEEQLIEKMIKQRIKILGVADTRTIGRCTKKAHSSFVINTQE